MSEMIVASESFITIQPLSNLQAKHLDEAPLYFRNGAMDIDPKRGLSINGPVDATENIQTIRVGIVSDSDGIQDVGSFLEYFDDKPIRSSGDQPFVTLTFPGFAKALHSRLVLSPQFNEKILTGEISNLTTIDNPNLRIRKIAEMYGKKLSNICDRVVVPDVIICHKPEEIDRACHSTRSMQLTKKERESAEEIRKKVEIHKILAPLDEDTKNFIEMSIKADFRRLLKSSSIRCGVPIQILTQGTLDILDNVIKGSSVLAVRRRMEPPSTIAWNLAVALYYKANHFPWRVGNLGHDSCYIGICFYNDKTSHQKNTFASLAQVFTDTGEGMIVRGDSFHWDTVKKGQPHLTEESAENLLEKALGLYKKHHNDQPPNRIVIHKTSRYADEEARGFLTASKEVPRHDYVSLSDGRDIFLYRNGENAVLRGTFMALPGSSHLVYTCGYVHYLKSYYGPRVPRPLEILKHHGDTSGEELAIEILALTRLDWNTTRYNSYKPITLRFAEKVGDILGSIPQGEKIEHQYRFYM